nr:hypothetical protein [Tanacetum cinerariifolium]
MSTQQDINAIRAQRLANTHDHLALMANTQTPFHPDYSSHITYIQHPQPNNNFVQQPSFNTNYMPQPMQNPKDSSDPTTAMNTTLTLLAKALKVNTFPTNKNQRSSSIPHNSQIAQSDIANQCGNGNFVTAPAEGNGNGIHDAFEETKRVKVNCTSEDTLQQASTSRTQSDNARVYDLDGSAEEKEYATLWNNWYKKYEECKYDKISYNKAYNDMQTKIEWLQAQLGDLKGKSSDTQCASNTFDLLS